ncbi:MAG: peptidylprolyl isomerase [Polyangiales bacterium]
MKALHLLPFAFVLVSACSSSSPPATTTTDASNDAQADDTSAVDTGAAADASAETAPDPLAGCTKDPGAPTVAPDPIDPAMFTLDKALAGFPAGSGTLKAAITTEKGVITCTFDEKAAPLTVANFIGLARGTRPYQDYKTMMWKVGRFYDGLIWHRVIPNFVIQGGDPRGNGTGGPGYGPLVVENHVDEPAGTLAMAATDAMSPSGSQFYIVVGTGPAADYNVFGNCDTEVAIAISEVDRNTADKPKVAVHMSKVDIARCP